MSTITRRWFVQFLGLAQSVNCSGGGGDAHLMECSHEWTKGPFYVTAAASYEEPSYYPPAALVTVEHCATCGIIRLPKDMWKLNGTNIQAGHQDKKP